jgi:Sec-independent protein secretion pathway component TatC
MKEVFYFLLWQWRKWEFWQKGWIVCAFVFGAGVSASEPYKPYLIGVPLLFIFSYMLKWMFWDGVRDSWLRYQKEKRQVVDILSQK